LVITVRDTSVVPHTDETITVNGIFAPGVDGDAMAAAFAGLGAVDNAGGTPVLTLTPHPSSNNTVGAAVTTDFELVSVSPASQPGNPGVASVLSVLPYVEGTLDATDEGFKGLTNLDETVLANSAHIQSFNFSLPLSRTPLQKIGAFNTYARPIDLPTNATLSVSALVNTLNGGKLSSTLCNSGNDITIVMREPGCPGDGKKTDEALVWTFKGAELESESMSSSIGDNKTVDLTYNVGVHGNAETTKGIFLLGTRPITP
jgi:hypothetical protein